MSNTIEIRKISIVDLDTDCIVNAANTGLWRGGGVCGAIFAAAGAADLEAACDAIGHCDEGSAVITPGFALKAKYIIHAVGPHWHGGTRGEEDVLYSAYQSIMKLVEEQACHSVGIPLISAGIFGYPIMDAWSVATRSVSDYMDAHPDADISVVFAVLDEGIIFAGKSAMATNGSKKYAAKPAMKPAAPVFTFSEMPVNPEDDEPEIQEDGKAAINLNASVRSSAVKHKAMPEFLNAWYEAPFKVEGITYRSAGQYIMAKKALLFEDVKRYFEILEESSPEKCKMLGSKIRGFDKALWAKCRDEIIYNADLAKVLQNAEIMKNLMAADDEQLDEIWKRVKKNV